MARQRKGQNLGLKHEFLRNLVQGSTIYKAFGPRISHTSRTLTPIRLWFNSVLIWSRFHWGKDSLLASILLES
jgi:hypothetical protein